MFNNEWWLWGPIEWPQPITEEEYYNDGQDAYDQAMEEEEWRFYDKLSKI